MSPLSEGGLRRRISQTPGVKDREWRELVRGRAAAGTDVHDLPPADRQSVGDKATVTAPPQPFGAHHGGGSVSGHFLERLKASPEVSARHVVGVPAKALHAPTAVLAVAGGTPSPTQSRKVDIAELVRRQIAREGLLIEPRQAARAWICTHVRNLFDLRSAEKPNKPLELMRRVPDREDPLTNHTVLARSVNDR